MSAAVDKSVLEQPVPSSLSELARTLEEKPWAVAAPSTEGDGLAEKALQVTKDVFDLGISLEAISHPHLHPFLLSILEPPSVNLRSSTKAKAQKDKEPTPEAEKPESFLPYTPLSILTTEGLDPEQVWAQLELRAEGISKTVKEVGAGEGNADNDDEDAEGGEDEDDEEESDEEMSVEEFRQMLIESGEEGVEDLDDGEIRALMEDTDSDEDSDEDEDEDDEDGGVKFNSDSEEDELDVGSDEEDGDENEDGEDLDGELGSDDEMNLGEDEEEEDEEEEEEEEDDGEDADLGADDDEEDDDATDLFAGAGPSKPQAKGKRRAHPTLDDQFFSIDEFNRQTEEAEAGRLTSGRLGGDEGEDEDMEDVGAMMLNGAGDDDEITYADFFEPPRGAAKSKSSAKGEGKGNRTSKDKKGKGKGVTFDDDDLMDEDEEVDFDDEDQPRGVFGRVKGDLFESDDEAEQEEKNLSNHEKRQLALAREIAELENEAVGPKDWTLLGEATSRARPENSLLEENLDFEQVAKVVPVITEESVKSLEDIIKARILDNNFDSPVRVRAYEPTPFLPSRYFELQDTQSTKSLAQIYEEEYQAAATGGKAKDPRDEKLRKEHEEIDKLWGEICYKLDALSSLNFVPKAPKAQITTISDLPTTTMESALPPTAAASTMLAPEELFAPPTSSSLVARSELTPEEAQKARQKARKAKQAEQKKLGDMADLYGKNKNGKKRMSVREEKEAALKGLVKSGKGVTVVGKGAKELGKAKKRGAPDDTSSREDGKRFKF
ncbi:U3 small nucleolar RNA-associated protein MPP10 [Kwoniella heveanensis BCC8398]|uniref:U3 small nucleolar ribonucleoprotein protein MPP10 n=1 Tax=Kwoniella heveanensis BCC8398 TaxID=1296120 RepID=A0A1B9GLY4_9TREE|nr:U3 small nucleolar RNA-associated protein MPP10 [Kwoniella heveanensis BCC8398]